MSRILYLHQHFSTPEGGTATRSYAQARALARAGHEVTVATGRYAGAETGLSGPFRLGRREGEVAGFRVVEWDIPYRGGVGLGTRALAFARYALRALPPALALRGGAARRGGDELSARTGELDTGGDVADEYAGSKPSGYPYTASGEDKRLVGELDDSGLACA